MRIPLLKIVRDDNDQVLERTAHAVQVRGVEDVAKMPEPMLRDSPLEGRVHPELACARRANRLLCVNGDAVEQEREDQGAVTDWRTRLDWEALSEWLHPVGRRQARQARMNQEDGADASQQALYELCLALNDGRGVRHVRAWLRTVVAHRVADARRRGTWRRDNRRGGPPTRADRPSPESVAEAAEIWVQYRERLPRLPAPYRQVALLRRLRGWSRSEVAAWLRQWRPIGEDRARQILVEADEMVRALWEKKSPEKRWPRRYDPRRNRWLTTPPLLKRL